MKALISILILLMLMPVAVQAGNGNGGGGGNGGPTNGDVYGDSVYLLRDENGVPILVNGCIRPLGADGKVLALNADLDPDTGDPITPDAIESDDYDSVCEADDMQLMSVNSSRITLAADAEDEDELEACDPIKNCIESVVETDLGRLSLLKSPDRVLDRQFDEVIKNLSTGGVIWFDFGGRFVVGSSTFDSPLSNMVLFREYLISGALIDPLTDEIIFDPDQWGLDNEYPYDFLTAAALALGAGADKEGGGLDAEIAIRTGEILGLPVLTDVLDTHSLHYEGKTLLFLDFSDFAYTREKIFKGNVCYDRYDTTGGAWVRESKSILDAVFGEDPDNVMEFTNIAGFALAADDARRVIVFTHDNEMWFADSIFEFTAMDTLDWTENICPPLN